MLPAKQHHMKTIEFGAINAVLIYNRRNYQLCANSGPAYVCT